MIVTSEPKRSKIDANSQPMIPPPSTTRRFGTFSCASRPVESTQRAESSPSIGGRTGNEPVATIALLNVTSSPPSTAIVFASLKRPLPFTHSTPFALKSPATPAGHLLDDRGLPLVRDRQVELRRADLDAELAEGLLGLLQRERGLHPRLGRDAADAQAGAAELGLLLDADDLRAELRGADRGRVAAGAASEDGNVTFHASILARRAGPPRVKITRRDRPDRTLASPRRQAGLRRAAHIREPPVDRGPGRTWPASTWRSSAHRPTTSSPTGPGRGTGRARSGRRAARRGRTSRPGVDALRELRAVDFGDAPVIPADPSPTHAAIEETVGQVADAGAVAVVLGGDHSITEPALRAIARRRGPLGLAPLRHAHRHRHARSSASSARTGRRCTGSSSRATSIRRATSRSGCAATGRARPEFAWQAERGITSFFMHDVRDLGIREVLDRALERIGPGPGVPDCRHRRARPGVRARDGDAGAGRDDLCRPALGLPGGGDAARARRRGRGRGAAERRSAPPT